MKRTNFNLQSYLHEAEERFSAFDGEDMDFDGEDLEFEGDDFEDFYGDEYLEAAGAKASSPSPYQISITNSTAGQLTAIIFGYNKYLLSTNFGSAVGIEVVPSQANVSYLELLQQSASQPFETSLIRIQSSNTTQVTQIINVVNKDANGQECTIPVITQSYFSANQFQSGIIDVPYSLKIDGNAYLQYPVLANTTVVMTFFPKEKINPARNLGGKSQTKVYGSPAVAIGIPTMPVQKRGLLRRRK